MLPSAGGPQNTRGAFGLTAKKVFSGKRLPSLISLGIIWLLIQPGDFFQQESKRNTISSAIKPKTKYIKTPLVCAECLHRPRPLLRHQIHVLEP